MLSLKEFAIPFGLLCFAIWVWLFASRPWLLLFAFFVTFAVVILFYRNEDVQQILIDAMAQLGNRSVEVLILRYEENLSDAESARRLGTSRGVIAVTLYRARARLKRLILKRLSEDKQP